MVLEWVLRLMLRLCRIVRRCACWSRCKRRHGCIGISGGMGMGVI